MNNTIKHLIKCYYTINNKISSTESFNWTWVNFSVFSSFRFRILTKQIKVGCNGRIENDMRNDLQLISTSAKKIKKIMGQPTKIMDFQIKSHEVEKSIENKI